MRIAQIHYAAPPIVGGVERIIEQQSRLLLRHGHEVVVCCGNRDAAIPGVETRVVPALAANPTAMAAGAGDFALLCEMLSTCDLAIVHNMFTMPFHWAASEHLAALSQIQDKTQWWNWVHDVDVSTEAFQALDLRAVHVAVSQVRQREFCAMAKLSRTQCQVIPNGLDALETLGVSPEVALWAEEHRLLQRDIVLFQPARVLARKNLEAGIRVIEALRRDEGRDAVLVLTGAPDPHRASSAAYAQNVVELIAQLGLQKEVLFAGAAFQVTHARLTELYSLADALFFPSLREGFGLPLVEASLHRLPVFCSDLPIHREVLGRGACFLDLMAEPPVHAATIVKQLDRDPVLRRRKKLLRRYAWEAIYEHHLAPLLRSLGPLPVLTCDTFASNPVSPA